MMRTPNGAAPTLIERPTQAEQALSTLVTAAFTLPCRLLTLLRCTGDWVRMLE